MMLSRPSSTSHPKVKFLSLFALVYIAAMLCSSVLRLVFWIIALVPWVASAYSLVMMVL
jgi:hypothetical protein